ncbi:MAG: DUF4440 domain-containing protein [Chitinophagales bacterium]
MKIPICALAIILFFSCKQPVTIKVEKSINTDSLKEILLSTDLAFSDLSKKSGRNAAFLEYMDEHVAMLRPNGMPMVGKDTMQKVFSSRPDTGYSLTWKPLFADVAASGDFGYTYGTYAMLTAKGDSSEGTYCSIWKRNADGQWKFVLDTGNEGLKPATAKP